MKIDILGGSYQQKYKELNCQRTINWYPVPATEQEKDKYTSALFPFPGLTTFVAPGGRYNRGLFVAQTHNYNRCFTVIDTTLYEILENAYYVSRGSLVNIAQGSSKIYMTCNANEEVGIFGYNAAYVFNMSTNVLTQITTAQYPGTATTADYLDGYTIITSLGAVYFNPSSALLTWDITDTFSPTFKPAPTIAVKALREEIYCFTSESIEVYINDGSTPYSRLPRTSLVVGLAAKDSIAMSNDGFIFLGRNKSGESSVYFLNTQYSLEIVSPTSVNWNLNKNKPSLEDAYGYMQYTKDGHVFYYLTCPQLQVTYVYDFATKEWCERSSKQPANEIDGSSVYREFRGRHYVNFKGIHLFADLYSGTVFKEDFTSATDNGEIILRTRISQTYCKDKQNISVYDLEIETNTGNGVLSGQGVDPIMMISISKDQGYTYNTPRSIKLGAQGNYLQRARIRKLGTSRNWTVKLSVSDPIDVIITSAVAKGVTAES